MAAVVGLRWPLAGEERWLAKAEASQVVGEQRLSALPADPAEVLSSFQLRWSGTRPWEKRSSW